MTTFKTVARVLLVAATIAAFPSAQSRQSLLFVENSRDGTVSVIDAATLKVVGSIDVGLSPDEIVASPSGDMLYLDKIVRATGGRPTAASGEFVAIDPATRTVAWRLPLHGTPNHIAVTADGKRVFVTIVSGDYVLGIDPGKRAVVDSITVGTGPHDIALSRDGKHGYTGLIRGTDVTVFDLATKQIVRKIPMGENVRPIAVNDDESRLYVQMSRTHAFAEVDPRTGKVLRSIPMPLPAGKTLPAPMPTDVNHGLRITRDGKFLIANGSLFDLTAIYALPALTLVATIPVGHDPNWVTLSPDGTRAFVSNRGSNDVSVIDLATRKEIARIPVGTYPQRMTAVTVAARTP